MASVKTITVGPYTGILAGKGGFATVYRVTGPEQRPYALKIANEDADDATKDSLYHEFTIQSELTFPQVIHAYEFGLHEGRPYIVLDWIEGAAFFERVNDPDEEDFLSLLEGMSRALLYVHHRGWVHGDLKPDNFIWRTHGPGNARASAAELCLLDFGLARPVGDANRPRGAGTVGYCAPEFLQNLPADGRADWYAAGVILYEWIFGVRPYADDEPAAEIAGHLEGTPNFGAPKVRRAPEWAVTVIERLLAKTADERGEDEHALLSWLAQFDARFEPTHILNQQLAWHARSESLRLRESDNNLLRQLASDLNAGWPANWTIHSHGLTSDALIRRICGLCASLEYLATIDSRPDSSYTIYDGASVHKTDTRIQITIRQDIGLPPERQPSLLQRSLTMLPWDRLEVHTYLHGIVGDEDVAEAWTSMILDATCGLPRAVEELLNHLLASSALSVDADGWGIDEEAIASWCKSNTIRHVEMVFGALSEAERALCEWLALGEGRGATGILRSIWQGDSGSFDAVRGQLVDRGLVVCEPDSGDRSFDLRLRLPGHDAHLRAEMAPEAIGQRSRTLAATLESLPAGPESICAEILTHAFNRAADWEKSATHGLRAATMAIKADDRERAMQFIEMAKESASRIENLAARSHIIGQARMVEGDLQKAVGKLDAARQTYRELLVIARANGDQRLLAETLHDLADLYYVTRRYYKGIRAERRALTIWERLNDRSQISRSLNSLGNLHRLVADFQRAREFFQQALDIQLELGLDQFAAINLNNIGLIHWNEYNFAEAESYFRQALAIQEKLNVPVEIARVLNNLGALKFVQGLPEESGLFFERAATLNAEAGAQSEELWNRRNLVEVALEQGDFRTAVTLGLRVYQACRELGDVSTQAEVGALIADAYLHAGDFRSARRMHTETTEISTSLKNDELRAYLAILHAAYLHSFKVDSEALAVLDSLDSGEGRVQSRYQNMDVLILRMKIAVRAHDSHSMTRLLSEGISEAEALCAPHKAAQLVVARAEADDDFCGEIQDVVDRLLASLPRWHWASAWKCWQARQLLTLGEFEQARRITDAVVTQLRHDCCWERLWRVLVLQGRVYHALADYEPAMRALDEAQQLLKVVLSTVDTDSERVAYLDCEDVRVLNRIRGRIAASLA